MINIFAVIAAAFAIGDLLSILIISLGINLEGEFVYFLYEKLKENPLQYIP